LGALTAGRKSFKGTVTQALCVALAGLGKLDDLASNHFTNWIGVVGSGAEGRKRHLEGKAHETHGLGVEAMMAVQKAADRHVRAALIVLTRASRPRPRAGMYFSRNLPVVKGP
jgi:hypothetical protein